MELTLPRLIIFLIIVGVLGDYAFNYQTDRELEIQFKEKLNLFERQRK